MFTGGQPIRILTTIAMLLGIFSFSEFGGPGVLRTVVTKRTLPLEGAHRKGASESREIKGSFTWGSRKFF